MPIYLWSCFFLATTSVLCLVGLASPKFRENLFMCVGMVLLALGDGSRAVDLWNLAPFTLPWDWFFVHAGMGMFAMGMIFDVYLIERRRRILAFAHSIVTAHWIDPNVTNPALARNSAVHKSTDHH